MTADHNSTELTGEIDLLCAIAYLRSAQPKAPAKAKPDVEWLTAHAEETLETVREHAEGTNG